VAGARPGPRLGSPPSPYFVLRVPLCGKKQVDRIKKKGRKGKKKQGGHGGQMEVGLTLMRSWNRQALRVNGVLVSYITARVDK